jgi:hypothetical protein
MRVSSWRDLTMPVLTLALALTAQRHIAWFAVAAAPCIALGVARLADDGEESRFLSGRWSLVVAAIACIVVAPPWNWWKARENRFAPPAALMRQIPRGSVVMSDPADAAELVLERDAKIVVDTRFERYPDDVLSRLSRLRDGNESEWDALACEAHPSAEIELRSRFPIRKWSISDVSCPTAN